MKDKCACWLSIEHNEGRTDGSLSTYSWYQPPGIPSHFPSKNREDTPSQIDGSAQMKVLSGASKRSLELPRNHIHLSWLDMEVYSTATWEGRRRNKEAGGSSAETKHFDNACVLKTSESGISNMAEAWLASTSRAYFLTLGRYVSQFIQIRQPCRSLHFEPMPSRTRTPPKSGRASLIAVFSAIRKAVSRAWSFHQRACSEFRRILSGWCRK